MARFFFFSLLASTTLLATGYAKPTLIDAQLVTIPARGRSVADTHAAIARGLQAATLSGRDVIRKKEVKLDVNLQDVTLFEL